MNDLISSTFTVKIQHLQYLSKVTLVVLFMNIDFCIKIPFLRYLYIFGEWALILALR